MFQWIGNFVSRTAWLWILLWIGAFAFLQFRAPAWNDHVSEAELTHLPENIASRQANRLFDEAFPGVRTESNVVLVLERQDSRLQDRDYLYLAEVVVPKLKQIAAAHGGVMQPSVLDTLRELAELKNELTDLASQASAEFDSGALVIGVGDEPGEDSPPEPELSPEANPAVREVPAGPEKDDDPVEPQPTNSAPPEIEANPAEVESNETPQDDPPEPAETRSPQSEGEMGSETTGPRVVAISAPHNSLAGPLLISADEHAMVVLIDLDSTFLTSENEPILEDFERALEQFRQSDRAPEGLSFYLTGSAVLGRDVIAAVTKSTNAVQQWTIWLVLALLLATFRAPLAAIIPLATLFLAVSVTLDVIAMLAAGGHLEIFDGLEIYTTVLVYGAGVDYSMFLISRIREERTQDHPLRRAVAIAVAKVGFAIVISAATEIFGIGMLTFADFGKFWQAGYAIPIGLLITLLASLTLTPSLLKLCGRWAFWPLKLRPRKSGADAQSDGDEAELSEDWSYRIWARIGAFVRTRPLVIWAGTVAVLAPFAVVAVMHWNDLSYDIVSGLPDDSPSLEGTQKLERYFSNGITGPIEMLLQNNQVDFRSDEGIQLMDRVIQGLRSRADELGLADVRGMSLPTGFSPRAVKMLEQLRTSVPDEWKQMASRLDREWAREAGGPEISEEAMETMLKYYFDFASDHFVSHTGDYGGHVTRLTLVLDGNPFARESITHIDELYEAVHEELPDEFDESTRVLMLGPTASLYDVRRTAESDRQQMQLLVTGAVLLILILLLRKLIVPIYLVLSVIFTYLVTMGVTYLVFQWWGGDQFAGLEWSVPILLFTLLMAVGADYNVLLVERYEEEKNQHGPSEAVVRSVAATGGLITGAGIVMAGTFLALNLGGVMIGMQQLGFALAFGVLIDTFIVRPILVPAFLLLFEAAKARKWKSMVSSRHAMARDAQ